MAYHIPALLDESIDGLAIHPGGVYVDVTFGAGGHAREILSRLTTGQLFAFDQDADAKANADQLSADMQDRSFTFIEANFRHLKRYLKFHGITAIDGLFADLGVSFHQFDTADRGFSTRHDGELDMRMSKGTGPSARELINEITEKDLIHMLSSLGEIRNARTLAQRIIAARADQQIKTSKELKDISLEVAPRGKEWKYLAQVYQAIRIEVNDELGAIRDLLTQASEILKEGGRLAVISYHSLEDRLVKNFLASGNFQGKVEKDFYGNVIRPMRPVNRKPIVPSEAEIDANSRSRSAKLRVGEKTNG